MKTYYNEWDKPTAQWLRNLSQAGQISRGDVDERSIKEVRGADVAGYDRVHFFAGIGGWDLALKYAGWPDEWPVWTGSCPCQPFSQAGKRRGNADERHLWPYFGQLIAERRPPVVFGEQVASKDGRLWVDGVRADLEAMGYAVGIADLCSAGVGAPNIRQRLYWVAYAKEREDRGLQQQRIPANAATGSGLGVTKRSRNENFGPRAFDGSASGMQIENRKRERFRINAWEPSDFVYCLDRKWRRLEPGISPLVDGVPGRVVKLRAYGNAINPILAAEFMGAFMDTLTTSTATVWRGK